MCYKITEWYCKFPYRIATSRVTHLQRLGQMNEEEKVEDDEEEDTRADLCVQLSTYMPTTHHACFRGFDAEGTIQGMDKGKRSFDPFCICLEKKRWTP